MKCVNCNEGNLARKIVICKKYTFPIGAVDKKITKDTDYEETSVEYALCDYCDIRFEVDVNTGDILPEDARDEVDICDELNI